MVGTLYTQKKIMKLSQNTMLKIRIQQLLSGAKQLLISTPAGMKLIVKKKFWVQDYLK